MSDLLGDVKYDKNLEEVVNYIDKKEWGKLEHWRVWVKTTSAVKQQHIQFHTTNSSQVHTLDLHYSEHIL